MSKTPEPPKVTFCSSPAVLRLIRSMGFPPNQTGDFTITAKFPVQGIVCVKAEFDFFMTPHQFAKLYAVLNEQAKWEEIVLNVKPPEEKPK